jgi:outer membrane protein insertion porin family
VTAPPRRAGAHLQREVRRPTTTRGLLAAAFAAAALLPSAHAVAQAQPGAPKPSRGAPGDRPGAGRDLGTEGSPALESKGPAESQSAQRGDVVERIDIVGREHTREDVVRAHLAIEVGKRLNPADILTTQVRLAQLGTFARVHVDTEPGSDAGRVIAIVRLVEKGILTVTDFTVAHTPVSPIYGALGIGYPSVAGLGFGAAVTAALDGQGRHGLRLTLYDPEVDRGAWAAGVQAIWQEGLESTCATPRCGGAFDAIPYLRYRRAGGELDAGWRPGVFSRILVGYRFEAVRSTTDPGGVPEARPALHDGRSIVSALVLAFDRDTRDDEFLPAEGSRVQAHITIGTRALGSGYEYSRYLLEAERWFPQHGGRALRLDAALGLVQGDAPLFDRFYAADWSYFSVGLAEPRLLELNFSPDSRYDALLAVVGVEYDFSLWDKPGRVLRRGVLMLGMRGVYSARAPDAGRSLLSATPVSLDAALRLDTSLGMVSIGLGYVTDQILKLAPLHVPGIQTR